MPTDLAAAILRLETFVPSKDFALSKRFYADLGFEVSPIHEKLAWVGLGGVSFLLQDYYVTDWANNFMMQLTVDDIDAWWVHIAALDLAGRYGVRAPVAPTLKPWGMHVAHVFDPAGVLWHVTADAGS